MSIAMGTRLHINLYIYKTTSVPILVLLSQNAQSDEKVILSCCTITRAEFHSAAIPTRLLLKCAIHARADLKTQETIM